MLAWSKDSETQHCWRVGSDAAAAQCFPWKLQHRTHQLYTQGLYTNFQSFSSWFIMVFEWHCMLFTHLAILQFSAHYC